MSSLNYTLEVFQMQNSDHHLLSCTGIAKTWGGGGKPTKKEHVRDYLIHVACTFSKPFICNLQKSL